jgi:hypothetical protein
MDSACAKPAYGRYVSDDSDAALTSSITPQPSPVKPEEP